MPDQNDSTKAALDAFYNGFIAIPIRDGSKRPMGGAWPHTRWDNEDQIREEFDERRGAGASGIGLLLGQPSGGLVDVDLDHPKSLLLKDELLPPSPMQTGRPGRPRSHRWYQVLGEIPATRQYKLPDRSVLVELRSTGGQTIIPPTVHPSGERIRWEGEPWGGSLGPADVDSRQLQAQVGLLAIGSALLDVWPQRGGRHEAYLALAGGLMRFGKEGVHPFWDKNLPSLIRAMAEVSDDDDGPEARVKEVMGTTRNRLRKADGKATGFPRLAELIGPDVAELVRRWAKDVEEIAGFTPEIKRMDPGVHIDAVREEETHDNEDAPIADHTLGDVHRNPLEERVSSWGKVDLEPYLAGEIVMPCPGVLFRSDGQGLFYPGRVNQLFGMSEAAKTWISLFMAGQVIDRGERVAVIDLEDYPETAVSRMRALGIGDDDIMNQFLYIHPEGPIAGMEKNSYGPRTTEIGRLAELTLLAELERFAPHLIIVDTMNVLYGLHGHDTNDATGTAVVTDWLKSLTRNGLAAVVVLDHTGKGGGAGASPIGAHHKVAMVQGSSLRIDVVDRPAPGRVGKMRVVVYKDRPGAVRAACDTSGDEELAGLITLDSTVPGISRMSIEPPDGSILIGATQGQRNKLASLVQLNEMADKALELFGGDLEKQVTTKELADAVRCSSSTARKVWEQLAESGEVEVNGLGKGRYYTLKETQE